MTGIGIFGQLASSLGPYVGGAETAGFILGAVFIAVMMVVLVWALGPAAHGSGFFYILGTLYVIVVIIQWFPLWTVIFIVVIVVAVKMFGSQQEPTPLG